MGCEYMKKITAFIGSARKRYTYSAASRFMDNLRALGNYQCELIMLSEYKIGICRGCKVCFEKGEGSCPMKDDRDVLIEKMMSSDGIIFATPNYTFQVSGIMKVFLDRLGFVCHRPRFFGKTFTNIVTQGISGGGKIMKYLNFAAMSWGLNTVRGSCHTFFEPMPEKARIKFEKNLAEHSKRFHERMIKPSLPPATLMGVMAFGMARTSIKNQLDERSRDYTYYRDKGWFESNYYYPTRVGPMLKAMERLSEVIAHRIWPPVGKGN